MHFGETSDLLRLDSRGRGPFRDFVPSKTYDERLESVRHNDSTDMRAEVLKLGHVVRFQAERSTTSYGLL